MAARAARKQPRQPRQPVVAAPARLSARRRHAASAPSSTPAAGASDWDRWLTQFRPEAQALWSLLIEVNCRLAREAYARELTARATA